MHSDEIILEEPRASIGLNEDLVIEKKGGTIRIGIGRRHGSFRLCQHESNHRSFSFIPPDGEFVVLNYFTGRLWRIFPSIEEVEPNKLEITILIRAEI
jgi:AP-4 complex subunit mu-1